MDGYGYFIIFMIYGIDSISILKVLIQLDTDSFRDMYVVIPMLLGYKRDFHRTNCANCAKMKLCIIKKY